MRMTVAPDRGGGHRRKASAVGRAEERQGSKEMDSRTRQSRPDVSADARDTTPTATVHHGDGSASGDSLRASILSERREGGVRESLRVIWPQLEAGMRYLRNR